MQKQLLKLAWELRSLAESEPTGNQVHQVRLELQRCEIELFRNERHLRQADALLRSPSEPLRWLGDIDMFTSDLVHHAKRLQRDVVGVFNETTLVATPSTKATELLELYMRSRS